MTMKRAVILDDWDGQATRFGDWEALAGRCTVDTIREHLPDERAVAAAIADYEIVVAQRERTPFPRSLVERLPRLELLLTTGPFNAVIDMAACAERGIPVWGTRGLMPPTTEHTWALVLACAKHVCANDRAIKAGRWQETVSADLQGARLGVIGLGHFGAEVARIGQAFGMEVVAWSQNLTPERCAEVGVSHVSQEELLRTSDVVTIHLVLSDRTRHLVGERQLRQMQDTAYLVNTSRGAIVDEGALVRALEEGWIAGAGLDVFADEPLPAEHPLRRLDNVVTTPHVGHVTRGTYAWFFGDVVRNIDAYLAGRVGRVAAVSPAVQ